MKNHWWNFHIHVACCGYSKINLVTIYRTSGDTEPTTLGDTKNIIATRNPSVIQQP